MRKLDKDTRSVKIYEVKSQEVIDYDVKKKLFGGTQAIWGENGFHNNYKQLSKIKDQNKTHENDVHPFTKMLTHSEN